MLFVHSHQLCCALCISRHLNPNLTTKIANPSWRRTYFFRGERLCTRTFVLTFFTCQLILYIYRKKTCLCNNFILFCKKMTLETRKRVKQHEKKKEFQHIPLMQFLLERCGCCGFAFPSISGTRKRFSIILVYTLVLH